MTDETTTAPADDDATDEAVAVEPEPAGPTEKPTLPYGFPDVPVHLALSLCMREIGHAPKLTAQQRGRAGGGNDRAPTYAFRSIDDVLNLIHGPLARHGVLIAPEVVEWEREPWPHYNKPAWSRHVATVRFTITGPRGDSMVVNTRAEALDDGDKGFGKLYSYAVKNALLVLFAIPTQPVDDLEIDGAARPETGSWSEVAERSTPQTDEAWRSHKPRNADEWAKYAGAWGRTLKDVRTRMGWTGSKCDTWAKVQALPAAERGALWELVPKMFGPDDEDAFGDGDQPATIDERQAPPAQDEAAEAPTEAQEAPADPEATDGHGEAENASDRPDPVMTPEEVAAEEARIEAQVEAAKASRSEQTVENPAVDNADDGAPGAEIPTTPAGWRQLLNSGTRAEAADAFDGVRPAITEALRKGTWSTAVHALADADKAALAAWVSE